MTNSDQNLLEGTLKGLDTWIADLIRNCEDLAALRLFACGITRLAMSQPVSHDRLIQEAVEAAEKYVEGSCSSEELARIHIRIKEIYRRLDNAAIELSGDDASDHATQAEIRDTSIRSDVAECAYFCTHQCSRLAAACVAYAGGSAITTQFIPEHAIDRYFRSFAELLKRERTT